MEHSVVSHEEWVTARRQHLVDEKEFTKARDRLSKSRRDLPWEVVDKEYAFSGPGGRATLADLFDGRGQLVIYHAMFNPDTAGPTTSWTKDAPCFVCSYWMDNFERVVVHLNHRDVTMAAVSHAPYPKLAPYRERMGWTFPYYSSVGSDFNFDYQVSFTPEQLAAGEAEYNYRVDPIAGSESPGISVFRRNEAGKIFHTYSAYARGLDMLNVAYHYLDIVPKGRDEAAAGAMWIHRRDEYPD
ncbi:MAG: DUF899 domain-containing protein [Candidatus Dormibacteraceae bacterium]